MLSTVVLPQPEWPITQVNSPRRIASQRSSKIVVRRTSMPGCPLCGHSPLGESGILVARCPRIAR